MHMIVHNLSSRLWIVLNREIFIAARFGSARIVHATKNFVALPDGSKLVTGLKVVYVLSAIQYGI